jgi:hypothetical protein
MAGMAGIVAAIAMAGLRYASDAWIYSVEMLTFVLLFTSILGAAADSRSSGLPLEAVP